MTLSNVCTTYRTSTTNFFDQEYKEHPVYAGGLRGTTAYRVRALESKLIASGDNSTIGGHTRCAGEINGPVIKLNSTVAPDASTWCNYVSATYRWQGRESLSFREKPTPPASANYCIYYIHRINDRTTIVCDWSYHVAS